MKKQNMVQNMLCILLCFSVILSITPICVCAETASLEVSRITTLQTPEAAYYGREALSKLENATALLYAYDQIAAGVENAEEAISVYDGVNPISHAEVLTVLDAYRRDYAHHFWLDNGFVLTSYPNTILSIKPSYLMTGTELAAAKETFEQKVTEVLSGIDSSMSEYEKELYLHDTLAQIATYQEGTNAHNAYGALVEGITVCEGYAEALQYLLQRAGIQSFIMLGSSVNPSTGTGEGHAWNVVRIDGEYYHVDLTWDDQDSDLYHAYFNQTDTVMSEDHAIKVTDYALPACTSKTAQYFTGKDTYLDNYTAAKVGSLLIQNDLKVHVYVPGSVSDFISWYQTNITNVAVAAGISESFSFGYSQLGHEVVIRIVGMTAAVTTNGNTKAYSTLTKAIQKAGEGATLRLLADTAESATISASVTLDLNGFDIAGDVTAANMAVYDSQTDDYIVTNGNGYGKIAGTVTGVTPLVGYVAITESDGTSFHKVDLAIKSLTLKAGPVGLYYTGRFLCDEVVARNTTCGIVLSTENATPVADGSDASCLYTTTENSVLLKNIMSEDNTVSANRANARTLIYGRAYMQLSDGTFLYSDVRTANLQTMVETVDAKAWDALSADQKNTLVEMYQAYSEEMSPWNISNLNAY